MLKPVTPQVRKRKAGNIKDEPDKDKVNQQRERGMGRYPLGKVAQADGPPGKNQGQQQGQVEDESCNTQDPSCAMVKSDTRGLFKGRAFKEGRPARGGK